MYSIFSHFYKKKINSAPLYAVSKISARVLSPNSSFYSHYWYFVTWPCAVTKLAPSDRGSSPGGFCVLFFHTRPQSQPRVASDLFYVTLVPRPDRTAKLIAKVKRNNEAEMSFDSRAKRKKKKEKETGR
ncbi:hypothetical protein CAJAP_08607 [Camponotus japonicus]